MSMLSKTFCKTMLALIVLTFPVQANDSVCHGSADFGLENRFVECNHGDVITVAVAPFQLNASTGTSTSLDEMSRFCSFAHEVVNVGSGTVNGGPVNWFKCIYNGVKRDLR